MGKKVKNIKLRQKLTLLMPFNEILYLILGNGLVPSIQNKRKSGIKRRLPLISEGVYFIYQEKVWAKPGRRH